MNKIPYTQKEVGDDRGDRHELVGDVGICLSERSPKVTAKCGTNFLLCTDSLSLASAGQGGSLGGVSINSTERTVRCSTPSSNSSSLGPERNDTGDIKLSKDSL